MADTKISALTSGTPALSTDQIPIARGSGNYSLTPSDIVAAAYKGTWNASTNTPTLTSSVGSTGNYYIVSTTGATVLDGTGQWVVGDIVSFSGTTWGRVVGRPARQLLGKSVTLTLWVVGTTGNDATTNGTTFATAFKTIQAAVDAAYARYDGSGGTVLIQISSTTSYANAVAINYQLPGGGLIWLSGQGGATSLTVASDNAIRASYGARVLITAMTLSTTGSGACIYADSCAQVVFGTSSGNAMTFGACAASHLDSSGSATIAAQNNYNITGACGSHLHARNLGNIYISGMVITLVSTPSWSAYFAGTSFGYVECIGTSFVGSGTGPKFICHFNGVIRSGTSSVGDLPGLTMPGSSPGVANLGGLFDAYGASPSRKITISAQTAAFTLTLPANCRINAIVFSNNNANAVTGGLKVGSTLGGSDVVAAQAVAGNAFVDSTVLSRLFSATVDQTLYVDAVTAWNSANVTMTMTYELLS